MNYLEKIVSYIEEYSVAGIKEYFENGIDCTTIIVHNTKKLTAFQRRDIKPKTIFYIAILQKFAIHYTKKYQ